MKETLGKVLDGMDLIKVITNSNINLEVTEQKNDKTICTLDIEKKIYSKQLFEGYEDVYRVLNWFKLKDIDRSANSVEKCNGLNCEDCDGCAYNTLTSIFNSRKIMEKHLGNSINEYNFIGTLSVSDELIVKSSYKKYISYFNGSYIIQKISLETQKVMIDEIHMPDKLFIDHYIPEILEIPNHIKEVYGLYKNKAVIWLYKNIKDRCCWVWEELK